MHITGDVVIVAGQFEFLYRFICRSLLLPMFPANTAESIIDYGLQLNFQVKMKEMNIVCFVVITICYNLPY
jgi:hypothetical protein